MTLLGQGVQLLQYAVIHPLFAEIKQTSGDLMCEPLRPVRVVDQYAQGLFAQLLSEGC